jgi:hypothetical protein
MAGWLDRFGMSSNVEFFGLLDRLLEIDIELLGPFMIRLKSECFED